MVVWYTGRKGPHNEVQRRDGDTVAGLLPLTGQPPFDWPGDGPRAVSLARALLVDALGPAAARCDECNGTGRVVLVAEEGYEREEPYDPARIAEYDPLDVGACMCEDGHRPLPVADFVTDHISAWPARWSVSRRELLSWLAKMYPQTPRWLIATMDEVSLP
jgi:hypothetical protein